MRISSSVIIAILALSACSQEPTAAPGANENALKCALDGAAQFAPVCAVERETQDGALFLTVRHPDGGFRRFEVMTDGSGVALADGSETGEFSMGPDGQLEAKVGDDRYRFPVKVKARNAADDETLKPTASTDPS